MRNLVFVVNEKNNYARHLGVVLLSMLKNSNVFWNIYILHLELSEESKEKIEKIAKDFNSKVEFIGLKDSDFSNLKIPSDSYFNKIIYAKLMIPELLDKCQKVILLDCDMVVLKPLEEVYDMDLGDYFIGAVPDSPLDQARSKIRLKLPEEMEYFNVGLLILDLEKLRINKVFQEVIEYAKSTDIKLELPEQDALNVVLKNNYCILPSKYNVTHGVLFEEKYELNNIGIIHYTGEIKPWDERCLHPLRKEYLKYLALTPWKGYKLENSGFLNMLKRELTMFKLKTRKFRYKIREKMKGRK